MFKNYKGPFLPLTETEIEIRAEIKAHVAFLSETLGQRNIWDCEKLHTAAHYIATCLNELELNVSEQEYKLKKAIEKNIIGEKLGTQNPDKILIIGAHYDTVRGSPGADDNASGIAGMLAIARLLKNTKTLSTIRYVAFVNEEPPFFFSKKMGSWQYANLCRLQKDNIFAMLSIESIGYYSDEKRSQKYPFPLGFFYPSKGNFIGFVGNLKSRKLVEKSVGYFRKHTEFPSEYLSAPWWFPGIAWSDQWSFWQHGYPAIMVTGTAPYRNPNYHTKNDTFSTLDYDRMARVVGGLSQVVLELANE